MNETIKGLLKSKDIKLKDNLIVKIMIKKGINNEL